MYPFPTPGWGRGAPQTPQNPPRIFFVCVLRPHEDVFAKKKIQLLKTSTPRPPPRPTPTLPPSPQNTHLNPGAIISAPTFAV